jgi:hypothetical protein
VTGAPPTFLLSVCPCLSNPSQAPGYQLAPDAARVARFSRGRQPRAVQGACCAPIVDGTPAAQNQQCRCSSGGGGGDGAVVQLTAAEAAREVDTHAAVRGAFPCLRRSMLTEIYLCHPCSCPEIWRMETAGQVWALLLLGLVIFRATGLWLLCKVEQYTHPFSAACGGAGGGCHLWRYTVLADSQSQAKGLEEPSHTSSPGLPAAEHHQTSQMGRNSQISYRHQHLT